VIFTQNTQLHLLIIQPAPPQVLTMLIEAVPGQLIIGDAEVLTDNTTIIRRIGERDLPDLGLLLFSNNIYVY